MDEATKVGVRDSLRPLLARANRDNQMLYFPGDAHRDPVYFFPDELEIEQANSRWLILADYWQLVSPQHRYMDLKEAALDAMERAMNFRLRMQHHLHMDPPKGDK